jgi:hypothetical protein
MPWWGWTLIGVGSVFLLSCVGCCGGVMWFGAVTPETFVYAPNEVPAKYLQRARDLGVLGPDEEVIWFYSDALFDVAEGMYFVTDQHVVIYREDVGMQPDLQIPYHEIQQADLHRDTSFVVDSMIELTLDDGSVVAFPVSSEMDRDEKFFDVIDQRIQR